MHFILVIILVLKLVDSARCLSVFRDECFGHIYHVHWRQNILILEVEPQIQRIFTDIKQFRLAPHELHLNPPPDLLKTSLCTQRLLKY